MRILIIQTAFTGDVILATALAESVRQAYPSAELDFLVRAGNESLLLKHPFIKQVWVWNKRKQKLANLLKTIKLVRKAKYDLVLNCQRFFSSGLITLLSGARQTIGFDKNPLSRFFTRRVTHQIGEGKHEIDRNLDLLRAVTDAKICLPKLYPDQNPVAPQHKYVCIAPTSVWFTKQWPADSWIGLIKEIPASFDVYLLGAPGDREACERIRKAVGADDRIYNLCGQLSYLESAALMGGATMNYVNDSAPMHLAGAVDAPVTAIYCSTVPAFGFTPLSTVAHIVETTEKLECRPCGLHGYAQCPKGHFRCANIDKQVLLNKLKA